MRLAKKILFFSNGSSGNVFPFIPVAAELRKHNIETVFMVDGNLTSLLKQHDFVNLELPTEPAKRESLTNELIKAESSNRQQKLVSQIANLNFRKKIGILEEKVKGFDLVIMGGKDLAVVMSLFTNRKEFILFSFNPFKKEIANKIFASNAIGRFGFRLIVTLNKIGWLRSTFDPELMLRPKLNIKPVSAIFERSAGNVVVTGPVYNSPVDKKNFPEGFSEFISANRNKKIVTIAFGSYSDHLPDTFLKTLVEAALDYGCSVILVSKTKLSSHELLYQFTDLTDLDIVFKSSDVVVHHCGHGTIIKTILCEKPFISIPLFGVQNEFASKLFSDGLTPKPINKLELNAVDLREALKNVFDNKSAYETRIKEKKSLIERENGIKEISEIILNELHGK